MTYKQFRAIKHLSSQPAGWAVLRDNLVLALDQVETGPGDLQATAEVVDLLRNALQISHARLEVLSR